MIIAGQLGREWSTFIEVEAEDESDFELEIANAVVNFRVSDALNFQLGWAPLFWADSYGILGNHFRLTRSSFAPIDQRFGGADGNGKLRSSRQTVGAYGRVGAGRLFYNANWSGDANNSEGEDANTFSGLVNYDITDDFMVGVFGLNGEGSDSTGLKRDYSRYGLQFQTDISDLRLQGLYVSATDDLPIGTGDEDNDAYALQAFYAFRGDSLEPTWVPLVRFDHYETDDGTNNFRSATFTLSKYFRQNIKAYIEYWDLFDAPTAAQEDSRLTLQITLAF